MARRLSKQNKKGLLILAILGLIVQYKVYEIIFTSGNALSIQGIFLGFPICLTALWINFRPFWKIEICHHFDVFFAFAIACFGASTAIGTDGYSEFTANLLLFCLTGFWWRNLMHHRISNSLFSKS